MGVLPCTVLLVPRALVDMGKIDLLIAACIQQCPLSISCRIYLTIIIFVCRGLIAGIFQALFVYTPEVYPTKVRALGLGTSSTFGRIGGIVVPYIAQVHVYMWVGAWVGGCGCGTLLV